MGFGNLGIWEMIIIAVVILIFFGPRRLPEIARSTGKAIREFKRGLNEIQRELELSEQEERRRGDREPVRSSPGAARGPIGDAATEPKGAPAATSTPEAPVEAASEAPDEPAPAEEDDERPPPDPNQAELFGGARKA